ncbi:MAG: hypothetical protein MUO26_11295, partial [Methanotrichaceae archaeon]|nr:hypothetical protein [Methanotrichaceae archaeon]
MDYFTAWILRGLHEKQGKTRLSQISDLIDWMPFRQSLDEICIQIRVREVESQTVTLLLCSRY